MPTYIIEQRFMWYIVRGHRLRSLDKYSIDLLISHLISLFIVYGYNRGFSSYKQ